MEPELWARVTDLFDAALEHPVSERRSYLERACGGDGSLLARVVDLVAHFERAGDFLESVPIRIGQALVSGDLLASRYRIETLLGRGGMGEVYRAHDELVGEALALKTLGLGVADDADVLRRFRREVQLARKVTHPSVCRVFEVGLHDGDGQRPVHFFTMQLLDGETLAARLRREGSLAKEEALAISAQIAEGLDAAHAVGVIHRDFKSSNVMLCLGRPVIMDFGLARLAPGERARGDGGSVSVGTQVAGTIAYMSPEQLAGGEITSATDVYSFGVVLYEMATGRLPFDDSHIIRSAMERASNRVPNVRAMAPELDPQLAAAIARCLSRDPARRYSSAREVIADLQPGWRPPMVYWTRRQWAKAALAAGALSGVALVPVVFRFYGQDTFLPQGADVLLGSIANLTNDDRLDAVTELFRNQLAQSVHVNLIDGSRIAAALRQMDVANDAPIEPAAVREAAWRLNAMLSIYGTVARIGPDYVLNVQLETRGAEPQRPRSKPLRSFSASDPAALMGAVREATVWVREAVGESAASVASFDRLPDDVTTTSWRALAHFARGQQFFMNQNFNPAIDKFTEALAEDSKFTLAALRCADLFMTQNRQTEAFSLYRNAFEMLKERSVTRPEELYGRGMYALDSGDLEAADLYFRTWSTEYPFDWRPPFYRALPLCMNGHAAQALEVLEPLRRSIPDYGALYLEICRVHIVLGQSTAARALLSEIRRLNRPERADLHEAYIRFREADCVGCLELLREVQRSSYRRGAADAMIQEGLLLIDAGYAEAAAANIAVFLGAGSWVDARPQETGLQLVQAWAEMLSDRPAYAIDNARRALQSEPGPLIVALAGTVLARTGATALAEAALRLCDDFPDVPLYRMARHRITGELARLSGDGERGLIELRAAAALEPTIAHRQYLIEALPPGSAERLELSLNAVRMPWQNFRPPPMHHIGAMRVAVADVNAAGLGDPFATKFAESSQAFRSLL